MINLVGTGSYTHLQELYIPKDETIMRTHTQSCNCTPVLVATGLSVLLHLFPQQIRWKEIYVYTSDTFVQRQYQSIYHRKWVNWTLRGSARSFPCTSSVVWQRGETGLSPSGKGGSRHTSMAETITGEEREQIGDTEWH